jgi:ribokinase
VIVVVGFASIDRSLRLDRLPAPGITARVVGDLGGGAARPGGIAHTVLALATAALDVEIVPVCAVGSDAAGKAYIEAMASAGCRVDGIVTAGARSPTTQLWYDPHGATACVFDPGVDWATMTEHQQQLTAVADVVVVLIGPPGVTRDALASARHDATIAWIVKNDPSALPPAVVNGLRRRADVIFYNAGESSAVDGIPDESAAILVCTDGPRPVNVTTNGARRTYPVVPVHAVHNPTGAGDAFAGGYLAAWLHSAAEADCVATGAAAARDRLEVA